MENVYIKCIQFMDRTKLILYDTETRPSQIFCKPPIWCRIEAPYWRF